VDDNRESSTCWNEFPYVITILHEMKVGRGSLAGIPLDVVSIGWCLRFRRYTVLPVQRIGLVLYGRPAGWYSCFTQN